MQMTARARGDCAKPTETSSGEGEVRSIDRQWEGEGAVMTRGLLVRRVVAAEISCQLEGSAWEYERIGAYPLPSSLPAWENIFAEWKVVMLVMINGADV